MKRRPKFNLFSRRTWRVDWTRQPDDPPALRWLYRVIFLAGLVWVIWQLLQ